VKRGVSIWAWVRADLVVDKSDVVNGDEVAAHQYEPTVVLRQ